MVVAASETEATLDAERLLTQATRRSNLDAALDWIADDHALSRDADPHALLRAIARVGERRGAALDAARRLTRQITASDLDTSAVLLLPETVTPVEPFRQALERLAYRSPGRTLARINSSAVIAAQNENPFVIEALCAVAGLSYGDLAARAEIDLPAEPQGHWSPAQVRAAFRLIDEIVCDKVVTPLAGAIPSRPLELMRSLAGPWSGGGWETVEKMRGRGVPYEVLLAQRAAGGAWLAHRNKTSGKIAHSIAGQLCDELDKREVRYHRATGVGGAVAPSVMHELSGAGKQLGLLAVDGRGRASYGVVLAVARDSGSASKSAARLRTMAQSGRVPIALVLAGGGWAARNETADLALHFEGRVFSERALGRLADEIQEQTAITASSQ